MGDGRRKMNLKKKRGEKKPGELGDRNIIETNKKGLEKTADQKSQKLLEGGHETEHSKVTGFGG